MRILICVIIGAALISFSCGGTNKHLRKSKESSAENISPGIEKKQISKPAIEIKEVEEKLVPIDEESPNTHQYFVIIGSFRNLENAKNFQGEIRGKGFSSEILKNEAGLFRISVMATNEMESARIEIRRIRQIYPEHSDTWLLIQKK